MTAAVLQQLRLMMAKGSTHNSTKNDTSFCLKMAQVSEGDGLADLLHWLRGMPGGGPAPHMLSIA